MKPIRSMVSRFAVASFSLLAVLSLASTARAQQIGYVLDMSGNWFLNGGTRLAKTSRLPGGGVIRSGSPTDISSFIVVANRAGVIIARRACNKQGECDNPIQLPPYKELSAATRVFDTIMEWWNGDAAKFVSPAPKGTNLNEAVVRLENNVLDLAQVFKNAETGTYYLRFEPLNQADAAAVKHAEPIAFKWDPTRPSPLGVCGLKVGLYRLSLLEPQGKDFNESGTEAWILVSSPERYDPASGSFAEALKLARDWGKQVKPNTARSFLRANLDLLSTQQK